MKQCCSLVIAICPDNPQPTKCPQPKSNYRMHSERRDSDRWRVAAIWKTHRKNGLGLKASEEEMELLGCEQLPITGIDTPAALDRLNTS